MKSEELKKLNRHFLKSDQSNLGEFVEAIEDTLYDNFGKCKRYDGKVLNHDDTNWISTYEDIPDEVANEDNILKDSMRVFNGQIRWNSVATMHNITPPILMDSIIGSMVANIHNPNVLWDFVSADAQTMERQVARQIADLCGWDKYKASGIFTFGGKACLLYAVRIGLNRAIKGYAVNGFENSKKTVVITSTENHYTVDYVCSFLGIGKSNCIRIPTHKDKMNMVIFKEKVIECMQNNILIAAVVVLGGNTINNSMDSLKEVHDIVEKYKTEYKLPYTPYIHFDTVVGWPWLFMKYYNFEENEFDINKKALDVLQENYGLVSQIKYADSMGIDFHKMGFVPYQSSIFMIKDGKELFSINKEQPERLPINDYGNNFTQHYTLEHSRSFAPIYSGWLALQTVGKKGFIAYLAHLTEVSFYLRENMEKSGFKWINREAKGFASVFWCSFVDDAQYEDALDWDKEKIKIQNEYIYNLYEVLGNGKYGKNRYIFACLPDYIKSNNDDNITTLRVFPMSLELCQEDIDYMVNDIKKIRKQFDTEYKNKTAEIVSSEIESIPR